jgi:hypothetical protein
MTDEKWIKLELSNDWGSYYLRDAGKYKGSLSYIGKQKIEFKRKKVKVRWPSGKESEEFLGTEEMSMEVWDQGRNTGMARSSVPCILVVGKDEIVRVNLSGLEVWSGDVK